MNLGVDLDREPVRVEPDAVAQAFSDYAPELRRFAMSRLRASVAAEDVVQESFLRLAVEARAGRFPLRPRAWLYRVAINLIISAARRGRTTGAVISLGLLGATEPVDFDTPESRCLSLEQARSLGLALGCVGSRARTGMIMAAEGYSGREIATALGRSEAATRALMSRARTRVRRSLMLAEAV